VEQTINTWPQLASSVALGGAVGADVCRRILLDQYHESGRYYIDLDELVGDKKEESLDKGRNNPFTPLTSDEMRQLAGNVKAKIGKSAVTLEKAVVSDLVNAANAAPSTGNDQPWKWLYTDGILYLYHDQFRSFSFGDFQKIASFISFGAAYENLCIHALSHGLDTHYEFIPDNRNEQLVAAIRFSPMQNRMQAELLMPLNDYITKRHTNRNITPRAELQPAVFERLSALTQTIPNAKLQWFKDEETLTALGEIIGACDRIRLLNKEGHHDFVHHEMRWTSEDAEKSMDGKRSA
jgi:hypothetical protein